MSHQITKVDLIPNGELSVCNVSQFDNGRVLPFEILENKEAYNIPNDIRVELHCRKPDGNIVTLPSESIADNIVTFLSTTQLTACYGKNICEIALYGPDDYLIGSANFILEVEKSPTYGGINSTSAIHNLHEQIEDITEEVVGENYYNKTEVDELLDDKANTSDVYTKAQVDSALALKANTSDVYTKAQVDSALALKANTSDVYTKAQVDSALALKANTSDVYTKAQVDSALALKANTSDVYTKAQVDNIILDIMPVDTALGAIATFNTKIAAPLVSVIADVTATGGNGTPDNPVPIVGYTEANITRCGANLFNKAFELGCRWEGDGSYTTGMADRNAGCPDKIPCKPSTTYCFVFPNYAQQIFLYLSEFDASEANIQKSSGMSINSTTHTVTFTTGANTFYMSFSLYANNDITATETSEVGVNYPATDTTYHAYTGNTYTIAFGQTVYGGVLDVTRGKLTVTHTTIEMPSTLNFTYDNTAKRWQAVISGMKSYPTRSADLMAEEWQADTSAAAGSESKMFTVGGACYFYTADNVNQPHGKLVYPLATPFDIDLTPEVISAIVGTNNVFADCGNISVKFKTTIEDYINSHTGG